MQIQWHGRDGRGGKDKGILTIPVEPEVGNKLGRTIKIMPGINDGISPEDWSVALGMPAVKAHIEAGNLLEVNIGESLAHLTQAQAIEAARGTIDQKLLGRWRASEKRLDVIAVIEKHVADLNKKPEKPATPKPA